MAISTYKTFLMHDNSGTYEKLIDIKEFPDLGGEPEMIDVTTLSDKISKYVPGIQSNEGLSFTCNYTKADYTAVKALEGKANEKYAVWFGGTESGGEVTPDGSNGKFAFDGELSVFVNGAGTNAPVEMTITIAPSSEIAFS